MRTRALPAARASVWIPAAAIAIACGALASLTAAAEPGSTDTLPLALAIATLTLAALLRPLEPAPGEKFSLAAAIAFFGALVLPGAQAILAVTAAEILARIVRRTSLVSLVVNVAQAAGATGAAVAAVRVLRVHPALAPGLEEVLVAGTLYLVVTLAPIATMIAWTRGAGEVRAFVAREWLPTSTLLTIGALGAAVWAAMPFLIALLVLPLAMVEASASAAARAGAAARAVERALEAQRAFVADAAHELRNPLAAVRGNLSFVRDDAIPDDEREALADARRDVAYVATLVDRLLLLARTDARGPEGSADLASVVARIAPAVTLRGGVTLELDLSERAPVAASEELVEALVRDLLANAAAYTERGRVRVGVRRTRDGARLEVRDTGVGVDPAELPRVFDRFFRGAAARRLAPGSGLGLAIARRIVEAHGGTIALAPAEGGGTSVTVTLPAASEP